MKKILFLLLSTIAMYGQVPADATPLENIQITNNVQDNSATKVTVQDDDGVQNWLPMANLPVSTATTNALELETDVSAGAITGFALTNNGDGTVNIASGTAFLRTTNDPYAQIIKYPISAVTNLALTDNANNFVLVDYNGGSPTITVTTNASTINTQTNSLAYVIARVGNNLEYLNLVGQNVDPNAKLRIRFLNQEGIRRASGAVLGFSNRNLTLTSSVLFSGLIRINAAAFNTASPDTFTLAYNNGSVWTRTTGQTEINNTQYNVSGTLTTMPNNTFRTDYVYLLPNNPSKLYVIMGNTTYSSLTLAKGAPRPSSLPVELQVLGLEVGRLFIEKNSAAIAEVQSSFSNDFIGAAVPEHNSLTGLQGGTSGEYNHLTNAQVALVNGSEQTSNKATSFSTVNNTLYPTIQAVKTYADGLVVGLLNDRGSYDASSNLFPSTGGSGTAGAILKGNLWAVSVAGTLGGVAVGIGDWVRALVDTPGQTASNWSVVEGNFGYVPANDANVVHKTGAETVTGQKTFTTPYISEGLGFLNDAIGFYQPPGSQSMINFDPNSIKIGSNTIKYSIVHSGLTTGVARDYALPNQSGTFALTTNPTSITATSFIKSGATSSDALLAGGGTLANPISGSLTSGYIPKSTAANSLGNSLIYDNGTNVGIGTSNPIEKFVVSNGGAQGIEFTPNIATNESRILSYNRGGDVYNILRLDGSDHRFYTLGTERASISNSGVFKINNLSGLGDRIVSADSDGNLLISTTPTAPTATAGTNTTQIATTAFVQAATSAARPYLVYTALLTQSGTSAPTATVLENTLGGTVVWSRDSAGSYKATLSGAFTNNKTFISFKPYSAYNTEVKSSRLGANDIGVSTFNTSGTQVDDIMVGVQDFEIRVYP